MSGHTSQSVKKGGSGRRRDRAGRARHHRRAAARLGLWDDPECVGLIARTIAADEHAFAVHVKEIIKPHGGTLGEWGRRETCNEYTNEAASRLGAARQLRVEPARQRATGPSGRARAWTMYVRTHSRPERWLTRPRAALRSMPRGSAAAVFFDPLHRGCSTAWPAATKARGRSTRMQVAARPRLHYSMPGIAPALAFRL